MSMTSDEVNLLVYHYLIENGFTHAAFNLANESLIFKKDIFRTDLSPGSLISFLQKGLQYMTIESHIRSDGSDVECNRIFSLASSHKCQESIEHEKKAADACAVPEEEILHLDGPSRVVFQCQWNHDSEYLVSLDADGIGRLWNRSGTESVQLNCPRAYSVDWHPTENVLALGVESVVESLREHRVYVMDVRNTAVSQIDALEERVLNVKWNRSGDVLAVSCLSNQIMIYNYPNRSILHRLQGHTDIVLEIAWASDTLLLSSTKNGELLEWNINQESPLLSYETGTQEDITLIGLNVAQSLMATGNEEGMVNIYGLTTAAQLFSFSHESSVTCLEWSPHSEFILASGSSDSTVRVWDTEKGGCLFVLRHESCVYSLAWCPSLPLLASGASDLLLNVWSAENGELKCFYKSRSIIFSIHWSRQLTLSDGDCVTLLNV